MRKSRSISVGEGLPFGRPRTGWGRATHLSLALALLAAGGCCRMVFGEIEPPPGETIVGCVHIRGASEVSASDIRDVLQTHSEPFSLVRKKPRLDLGAVATDARRIEAYYASRGYFEARVVDYRVQVSDTGLAEVTFDVIEGSPTRVRRVRVHGLDPAPPEPVVALLGGAGGAEADEPERDAEAARRLARLARRARSLIAIREGQVWREERYSQSIAALQRALRDEGFAYAEVVGQTRVSRPPRTAEVRIVVVPGPLVRAGAVLVEGLRDVPERRVLRRVAVRHGDVLDANSLDRAELDVFGLGVFHAVDAEAQTTERDTLRGADRTVERLMERARDAPASAALRVRLQERPLMDGRVGGGAAVETNRGEVYALGGFGHRDLFGGLQRLELLARPAVVLLPSLFEPDIVGFGTQLRAGLRQPSFIEEYITGSLDTSYQLGVDLGFRFHQVDARASVSRPILARLIAEVGFSVGYIEYFDFTGVLELPLASTLGLDFRPTYLVTEMFQSLVYDHRDDPLDAKNGFYGAVSAAQSLRNLGSDFHYIRFVADARVYFTTFGRLTLAGRVKFGQVINAFGGDVPLSARFRGGGPGDMRGYSSGRMGPFLCQRADGEEFVGTNDARCGGDKVFVGGNLMFVASAEARVRMLDALSLAFFVDAGQIWSQFGDFDIADVSLAVGPGVRYLTPIGPLRLDFGFLVSEGVAPPWVFHFSIGQAF